MPLTVEKIESELLGMPSATASEAQSPDKNEVEEEDDESKVQTVVEAMVL